MNPTKNPWYILLGGLDLLSFVRNLLVISVTINLGLSGLSAIGVFNVIAENILLLSLLVSAVYTFKRKKMGLLIYFLQLPLRIYFAIFSFGFIMDFVTYSTDKFANQPIAILIIIIVLEVARLIFSIVHYKKIEVVNQNQIKT